MTPHARMWSEMSDEDRVEESAWRRQANQDQIRRADELCVLWYAEKDDAARCKDVLETILSEISHDAV